MATKKVITLYDGVLKHRTSSDLLAIESISSKSMGSGESITADTRTIFLSSDSGQVALGNPQISSGYDGQEVNIIGASDSDYVSLSDGNGLKMIRGPMDVKYGHSVKFVYVVSVSLWIEVSRNSTDIYGGSA